MNRSVHKDTCRIWDRGVCNCGPINAAPESRDAGGAASGQPCKTCGGTGVVDDGEITGVGGVEFSNGPVKCFKNCPACADRYSIQGAPTPPAPSADSDGDECQHCFRVSLDDRKHDDYCQHCGRGEAVAPEAKPEWPKGAFFTDGEGSFYDEQAEPLDHAFAPPAPPAPLPGKPLTKDQIAALLPLIKAEVDTLSDEGRYTFAGWLPIAVRLIEKHHGIAALSAQAAPEYRTGFDEAPSTFNQEDAAPADYPPHLADEVERELALMIDRCPEPLRRLSDWLANKLDEDDWKTAERLLLGAVESVADRAQRSGVSVDPLPNRVSLSLGPVAFQFTSHQQWVNKAQSWFANLAAENPNAARKRYLCIDAKGRVCMIGKDFGRARDEDAFPVKLYLIDAAQQHQVKKGEPS